MKVTDRSGQRWLIGRRILPWRRRLRMPDVSGLGDLGGGDDILGVILLILAIPVLVVTAVFLSEVLLLLLLLPVVVLLRVAFKRPWIVDVRPAKDRRAVTHTEQVVGWRAAGERVQALAKDYGSRQRLR